MRCAYSDATAFRNFCAEVKVLLSWHTEWPGPHMKALMRNLGLGGHILYEISQPDPCRDHPFGYLGRLGAY